MTRRKRMMADLEQDLRDHLHQETQDNIDRGMAPAQARTTALRKFGNPARVKEATWEVWSVLWLEQLIQDIRFATRTLLRSPGLTAAAILAIALGVGVNVGIFSVLNGLFFRPLPVPRAHELVSINQLFHFKARGNRVVFNDSSYFSYSEYLNYRNNNHVFSGLLAYEPAVEATLHQETGVQTILGTIASCNYFDVLTEYPARGRGFVNADCAGHSNVVVLSDGLWRNTFASDASLVGKRIVLNQTAYIVIGIAQPGFAGTELTPSTFWAPITMQQAFEPGSDRLTSDNTSWLALLGRLRPGVSIQQARSDVRIIAGRIDQGPDQRSAGRTTALVLHAATLLSSPEQRAFLLPVVSVVLAAFALVLLIACANVASLLLARASARQKEIALRLSLGAGRSRLVRQLLTESLLLSLAGGALGSVMAFWSFIRITQLVAAHLPHDFPPFALNVAPNLLVLVYALLLSVFAGVAFGLVPAWQSAKPDLNTAIKNDAALFGGSKVSGRLLLNTLVGTQVAVCMVLLLAAGLLLRGLYNVQTVHPGFAMNGVATVLLDLRGQGYDATRASRFMQRLRAGLKGLPGVIEDAQAECAPLSHDFSVSHFTVPGAADSVTIEYNHITPGYFSLLKLPIVRGRDFSSGDTRDSPAIIVTESTARRLWPGQDPLGKTLREDSGRTDLVVGVAKDAQVAHLGQLDTNYLYFPAGPEDDSRSYVLVRHASGFAATAKSIRDVAQSIDPNIVMNVTPLEDYLEVWRAPSRIAAALSGALGALALLLCSIGVYGMVSYTVSRSVHDIGIRMALGAHGASVMRHVLWQAMRPVLIGASVGIALCAIVSGIFTDMMFGLGPHDPVAFIAVPVFLIGVALLATCIPGRRALRVDPMVALRSE